MTPSTPAPPRSPRVTAVVPTLGRSPWLAACLAALRAQRGAGAVEVLVVDQGDQPLALPAGLADRVLRPGRNLGFAGGTNLGIVAARGALVATVNDDALVELGWLAALAAALDADPTAGAAQGVNLVLEPTGPATPAASLQPPPAAPARTPALPRVDGCGLGWNSWWQAVQLGHGAALADVAELAGLADRAEPGSLAGLVDHAKPGPLAGPAGPPAEPPPATHEVFGVSATAALFRRAALDRVAPGGQWFDARLESYYEDAELAGRLREAGFRALLVPAARACHGGSTTGRTASRARWRLIYGNRYLAAARLLGRGFWVRLPRMACRDLADLLVRPAGEAPAERRARRAGIALGWLRAARLLPAFVRRGAPVLAPADVARLSRLPTGAGPAPRSPASPSAPASPASPAAPASPDRPPAEPG